jgi:tetratricopeptide (TPR) repeat protein
VTADNRVDLVASLRAYSQADSRETVLAAIRQLERFAAAHPGDYTSRARLANAYTLYGAFYVQDVPAKEAAYTAALRYAEAAMLTVPGFAHVRQTRGVAFHFALQQLDHRHLEAMEFWKAALLYDYEECSGAMSKVLRYGQLMRAVAVMDRMDQIDRNANWGNNRLARGFYLYAMPAYMGGDVEQAQQLIGAAVQDNPRNIVPRWGRAKYVALAESDRELFKQDLQWVVAQPLDELVGYRPWNVAIQQDARRLLKQTRRLFK